METQTNIYTLQKFTGQSNQEICPAQEEKEISMAHEHDDYDISDIAVLSSN